jgi:hypothetical protein
LRSTQFVIMSMTDYEPSRAPLLRLHLGQQEWNSIHWDD